MEHRNDIDGLRAVAVIPILLFHIGVTILPGGFAGVDVFFVISGYLITSIICREMDDGKFSIAAFYKRRIVRILPALVFMLVGTLIAGKFLLLAVELRDLGRSAAAAIAFVANVHFWNSTDYFDAASETKLLLHSWSLGVEEQFYLFYPILLLVVRRWFPRALTFAVSIVTVGSFVLCLYYSKSDPATAFYLLPMRAWELGVGALVALNALPRLASRRVQNLAALTGAVLLFVAFAQIRTDFAFPAPWALLPCIGTMLLIAYGRHAITAAILSLPPVRAVGLISYSLYLWHWPIATFYRLENGMVLSLGGKAVVVSLTFAIASISYLVIERPFLRRYRPAPVRPVLVAGGAAIATVAGASLLIAARAEAVVEHPAQVDLVGGYLDYRDMSQHRYQFRPDSCFIGKGERYDFARCLVLRPDRANVIVMGDSHAAQYWRAIALRFPNINVVQATASGCRPTVALTGKDRCVSVVRTVFNDVIGRPGVVGVVLAGRWQQNEVAALGKTVKRLRERKLAVTVIGPNVEYQEDMPRILARAMLRGDLASLARRQRPQRSALDHEMRPVVEAAGGRYVSEIDIECPGGHCQLFDSDGGPYHFDYGHLTFAASRDVVRHLPNVAVQ
ncbi:acyltransferase family protein [Sphingomonas sp. SAFR-052]|uniref:acyltransferase family protein n=1 Tax=Sphingomonas sp. SAFR-052 TaxID=3436867 RepID=UPI003F7FEE99